MVVHSLFILKESGVCVYSAHISNHFKELPVDLVTPFFSAILSFSNRVISKQLDILEMGDVRLIFKKERGFIFVLLSDSSENLLFIQARLNSIVSTFFKVFSDIISDIDNEVIRNSFFDATVESIVLARDEMHQVQEKGLYEKVVSYLKDLQSKKEIMGAALLTTKGTIIYSTLTEDLILRVTKELEIRYMTGTFDVPQLLYTLGNNQKVCEKVIAYRNFINLLLVLHFGSNVNLGLVDYNTESIVEKLKSFM